MIYRYYRVNYSVSQAIKTAVEKRKEYGNTLYEQLENVAAKVEYKSYPYHIAHYDPESPDYIPSDRDDYRKRLQVDVHNHMIDKLKRDLKMQKHVDEALNNLDRPYLRGKPGVTRNVTGGLKDYFPVQLDFQQEPDVENFNLQYDPIFRNEKRWIAQTIAPHPKPSWHVEWQKSLEGRPVNAKFHPDKGSKYDVETPYEHRYPYLADRLGHPEFLANPVQRLARLESDMYHPVYNDQPFVQHPSAEPDPTLNFEEGEVIYENTRLLEWMKLNWWMLFLGYGWFAVVMPINLLYKTNLPTENMLENNFYPYHLRSLHNFDYMRLHVLGLATVSAYGVWHCFGSYKRIGSRYVTKVQYNKDKELIFVTRCGFWGNQYEEVYETHHLEVLPYFDKTAVSEMKHLSNDGMYEISCLNTMDMMWMYKQDKFWNPKLKKQFLTNHSQLITKQYFGLKRQEELAYTKEEPKLATSDLPVA